MSELRCSILPRKPESGACPRHGRQGPIALGTRSCVEHLPSRRPAKSFCGWSERADAAGRWCRGASDEELAYSGKLRPARGAGPKLGVARQSTPRGKIREFSVSARRPNHTMLWPVTPGPRARAGLLGEIPAGGGGGAEILNMTTALHSTNWLQPTKFSRAPPA
jgi:hypothetical protein